MHRLLRIILLLPLALALSRPGRAGSLASDRSPETDLGTQSRLVVFEAFFRST